MRGGEGTCDATVARTMANQNGRDGSTADESTTGAAASVASRPTRMTAPARRAMTSDSGLLGKIAGAAPATRASRYGAEGERNPAIRRTIGRSASRPRHARGAARQCRGIDALRPGAALTGDDEGHSAAAPSALVTARATAARSAGLGYRTAIARARHGMHGSMASYRSARRPRRSAGPQPRIARPASRQGPRKGFEVPTSASRSTSARLLTDERQDRRHEPRGARSRAARSR